MVYFSQKQHTFVCKKSKNNGGTTPKPTEAPNGHCPIGFKKFQSQCYKVVQESDTWSNARGKCKQFGYGYDLVSIHSRKENSFVSSMLYEDSNMDSDEVWIGGLTTSSSAQDFQWSDQSPFNMVNWATNQPDGVTKYTLAILNRIQMSRLSFSGGKTV